MMAQTQPLDDERDLWAEGFALGTDPDAQAWLRARHVDPDIVDSEALARVLGAHLVLPAYDLYGSLHGVLAHDLAHDRSGAQRDHVLACGRARALLERPAPARLILCDGAVRFLELASTRSDSDESAVLGIARWTSACAARIADGSHILVATSTDRAGDELAAAVVASLRGRRVRLARWRPSTDAPHAPGLSAGEITPIDPLGWRTPVERAMALGAVGAEALPSPFPGIDTATRGGLRPGRLLVLAGAPGAGKTSLAVQLARHFCRAGHPVGFLASDEAADGILVRWGQQEQLSRDELEQGVHATRKFLAGQLLGLPLVLVDADEDRACLEDVAERVVDLAQDTQRPGVLVVDSIQTARVRAHDGIGTSPRERVEATVNALKRAHRGQGLLVLATCEVSRGLYRGGADPKINPLAAGKESGAIEYAAEMLLVLTSVAGESDLVDVAVPKNRIGGGKDGFRIKLDRDRCRFEETSIDAPEDQEQAEDERDETREARVAADAEVLFALFLKKRAQGIKFTSKSAFRKLVKGGRTPHKQDVVDHLFNEGRLVGGGGKPIDLPSQPEPTTPTNAPEDDG